FELEIPTRDEMLEIELSNRFYQYNGAVFATATMLTNADTAEPQAHAISFILVESALLTVRYATPYSFSMFEKSLQKPKSDDYQGVGALCDILELTINRIADLLENTGHKLDNVNTTLFRPAFRDKEQRQQNIPDFEGLLLEIGIQGDLLSKLRESLISLTRLISFVTTTPYFRVTEPCYARTTVMLRDITALNDQVGFHSSRLNFLLDTTLGMIGIQQTGIIKIFSVASVVFLPPTLVASIYGMNFEFMPELHYVLGYPISLTLMVLSALLPYLYFKKKWL
ncbi:MAG: magnesium transporter, partial [Alphaproteobacteria bacterium]|nr:magnesium transporter [Alphaproteobacteria bacterium]